MDSFNVNPQTETKMIHQNQYADFPTSRIVNGACPVCHKPPTHDCYREKHIVQCERCSRTYCPETHGGCIVCDCAKNLVDPRLDRSIHPSCSIIMATKLGWLEDAMLDARVSDAAVQDAAVQDAAVQDAASDDNAATDTATDTATDAATDAGAGN
ncbi:hypothetical protein BJX70DRAFT_393549 [Aspergillus crustosus]